MPPPLLELENATVVRGGKKVFDRLSLEIPSGCHGAILGPNGAGKSTLLQLLTRELYPVWSPDSRVRVLGRERWNVFDLREELGLVSHELQLRYQRDVRGLDVVVSGLFASIGLYRHHPMTPPDLERAEAAMERLGILGLRERPFTTMSAGEQRRCLLARALVNDPPVLVLDEPMASLDLRATFDFLALLRRLPAEGKTLVLVTHRVDEIPPEVTWALLLKEGRVLACGDKRDVLTQENVSRTFEVDVRLLERDGFYRVLPA